MEETKQKRKPKRVLKNIDFEKGENTHLALVHRDQGGPANGADYKLVVKSVDKYSDEFLEKASSIKVDYEINEYLLKFFESNLEDIAGALGKETIEEAVASIDVMKQLYESENIADVLSSLTEDEYLQLLQDQASVEAVLKKMQTNIHTKPVVKTKVVETESTEVAKTATEDDTSTINACVEKAVNEGGSSPVVVTKHKEKKSMTEKTQVIEQEVEVIAKAQFDAIQKQMQEQQVELQKALDLVKQFEAEKKEAIAKARKEQIVKSCGKHADVIFKAVGECEEETFVEVVKALSEMQELVEKSALFQEQGASVSDVDSGEDSAVAKLLKAKFQSK